ncbi:RAS2 protein [Naganishia albida]|nr:RAS2 protein [Naganishia albida]
MSAAQRSRTLFKVTVLGDGGVGKTALTVQFTMASFVETYDPTIEDCYRKQWSVDGQPCLLEVLDTAGQEEYTALRDQWIRDGEGFLIVYSVASRDTFDRVESILRRVRRVKEDAASLSVNGYSPYASPTTPSSAAATSAPIVIIGNKRDLPHGREVMPEEGQRLAQRLGCEFFETSAKTGYNVDNAFKSVVRGIRVSKGLAGGVAPTGNGGMHAVGEPSPTGMGGVASGHANVKKREKRHKRCVIL